MSVIPTCKSITDEKTCKTRKDCLFTATKKCRKLIIINKHYNTTSKKSPSPDLLTKLDTNAKKSPTILHPKPVIIRDDPCGDYQKLLGDRRDMNKSISDKNKQCEELMYSTIQQFFKLDKDKKIHKTTYKDLLEALMFLYKKNKENPNFFLTFHSFIQMFAKSTMETLKFKRQHVFEAMCKIMLFLNYDNGELGMNKQFYESLEKLVKDPKMKPLSKEIFLETRVNESSKGGVVDILFKTEMDVQITNCKDGWGCDCVNNVIEEPDTQSSVKKPKPKLIMIQNKYYDAEKTNNKDEYDIAKIYSESQKLKNVEIDLEKQIVLMVNNKEALDNKLYRSRELIGDYEKNVYGVKQLEDWFRRLLHDLSTKDTIEEFIESKLGKKTERPVLYPRFHQQYFTNTTLTYNKNGYKLFIWGAVPRSGKSYMIADFISNSKLRSEPEQDNDIVLILGAKTETESQFIDMFCKYSNFDDYGIIVSSHSKNKCARELNKHKEKNIYIFSQEWFKTGKIDNDGNFIAKSVMDKSDFRPLFEKRKIDIYFDEIHKGGTTTRAKNILQAFHNANVKIDIFIMVTATFAKPNIRYNSTAFIDIHKKSNKIIEWSYEDQQMMKKIDNETSKQLILNSKKKSINEVLVDTIESVEIGRVFDSYKELYGPENYLDIIAKEYEKHPELVIVSPEVIKPITIDLRTCFITNLKCEACKTQQTEDQLREPRNIFNDIGRVNDLLNYIAGKGDSHVIDTSSVYSYLQNIGAPTNRVRPHTELWFLPDKNLYADSDKCRQDKICSVIGREDNYVEDDNEKNDLPNIEPVTRGLALLLMEHPFFKKNYNVLIVHNTKPKYTKPDGKTVWDLNDVFEKFNALQKKSDRSENTIDYITTTLDSTNLSESIKQCERKAFYDGKSLIVLTGAKLRLGISLPCADIAFNFDDVKSIDNNYQTMFRVLTERYNTPKLYGYYVDFNKDRAKTFLYEYNVIYSSGNKQSSEKRTEALQSLMFMFNYNGLGLFRQDTTEQLVIYNNLIKELQLDEASYKEHMTEPEVMKRVLKKSIGNLSENILKKLKSAVSIQKIKSKGPDKIQKTMVEGQSMINTHVEQSKKDDNEIENEDENDENDEDDQDDMSKLIDNFTEIMPSIIALLALFSDKNHYNCDNLVKCIDNCIENVDALGDTICNCDTNNVLICYLNSINNENPSYTKTRIIKLLEIVKEIITNPEYETLTAVLNNIYEDIKETMVKSDGLIFNMTPEEIQKKIEEYLPVRSEEKDKHGEVFTPSILIDEMLDKLPKHVWKNPNLKWLDPANGIGNFPMIIYGRLMDGLKSWEPNKKKRSSHIIEKMLYMVEINPRNVKVSKKIFGDNANICCADFLEEEPKWRNQFGFKDEKEIFDVIIGNPPFQNEKSGITAQGGHDLYPKFFVKSFHTLKPNGYLSFINPSKWRAPDKLGDLKNMWDIFIQNNPLFLKIYGFDETKKLFKGGAITRIDYYILQKSKYSGHTVVNDELHEEHKINLLEWKFLPNYDFINIKSILTEENNGIKVIYSRGNYGTDKPHIKKTKSEIFKYPVKHSHTIKDGDILFWSNTNKKGHFGEKKVILGKGLYPYPYNDFEGKYGMSNYSFGIPIASKKQGDDIVKAINTDEFGEILKATKWSSGFTDHNMFKYFKPDFYKHFLENKTTNKTTAIKYESADNLKKSTNKKTKKHNSAGGNKTRKHKSILTSFIRRYTRKNI